MITQKREDGWVACNAVWPTVSAMIAAEFGQEIADAMVSAFAGSPSDSESRERWAQPHIAGAMRTIDARKAIETVLLAQDRLGKLRGSVTEANHTYLLAYRSARARQAAPQRPMGALNRPARTF